MSLSNDSQKGSPENPMTGLVIRYHKKAVKFATWKNLQTVSELWIVNAANLATLSIPIIAGLSIVLDNATQKNFDISISLEFVIIYFAGLLSVIAKTLTSIACPPEVKAFGSLDEYVDERMRIKVQALEKAAIMEQATLSNQDGAHENLLIELVNQANEKNDWHYVEKWQRVNEISDLGLRKAILYLFISSAVLASGYYFIAQPIKVIFAFF